AVARFAPAALQVLQADQRLAKQPASEMQQPPLGLRRQSLRLDARAAAEGVQSATHVLERDQADAVPRLAPDRLGEACHALPERLRLDRKSTRLNSSHVAISYAVFCLKKNTGTQIERAHV